VGSRAEYGVFGSTTLKNIDSLHQLHLFSTPLPPTLEKHRVAARVRLVLVL
jgi:hypothetical protein